MKAMMVGTLMALAVLAGCGRDDEGMGPAQKAGKVLDEAGARVSDTVQDELAKADRATEEARDKVKDATRDASRELDKAKEELGRRVERAGEKMQAN
ncbi:hypothetical protein [Massilia sp. KIM]|uniref:hypothetical protein n=1 Tax=Massilia sp. KIM TaxID=1955422 RepID=UPI001E557973|nr:hypothetical protein [Massilia sp. KIM]